MNLDTLYEFEISSRRRIDPSKYQDVKPWVPKAIAGEDQKPKTQLWEGEPTEDGQKVARLWRIKFLRKYEKDNPLIKAIADRLAACRKENDAVLALAPNVDGCCNDGSSENQKSSYRTLLTKMINSSSQLPLFHHSQLLPPGN
jgi:hypothetical protein